MTYFKKQDIINIFVIIIAGFIFACDLFLFHGRPITFDGHVHITTISQFYQAMQQGEWFPRWSDGFANYGFPLPLVAHQIPSYLGSIIRYVVADSLTAFNLVAFFGVVTSSLSWYWFLRLYAKSFPSLVGTLIYNFAAYRIFNIYIRGAVPELFASIFLPTLLIGIYMITSKRAVVYSFNKASILIALSITCLVLTHPMTLVLFAPIYIPYTLFRVWHTKCNLSVLFFIAVSAIIGLLISAYYFFPLLLEIKYFVYGSQDIHYFNHLFLTISEYFQSPWAYFGGHPGPRADLHAPGVIEIGIFIFAFGIAIYRFAVNRQINKNIVAFLFIGTLCLFFTNSLSEPLYAHIKQIGDVQHPWRFLGSFIFIPSFLINLNYEIKDLLKTYPNMTWI